MPLTVVVGSSGSGKTTFLNDTYESHQCVYIQQYHTIRPFVTVCKIPHFDPTQLPFWDIYVKEGKADSIQVGGSMAGEFTAGLSGGQRKLLIFEIICQRTKDQEELLLLFDEPFAGVTDDFVPFIVDKLKFLREKHNVVLVTNDHIAALTELADNTITVSVIDRQTVQVNDLKQIDREKVILALTKGNNFKYKTGWEDVKFFWDVEVVWNKQMLGVLIYSGVVFAIFIPSFWGSLVSRSSLVLVAAGFVAYISINGYLIANTVWRNYMIAEADALIHSSKRTNRILKAIQTVALVITIALFHWGAVNAVMDTFRAGKFFVAILFDNASFVLPYLCFALYTRLKLELVDILASSYFLFMFLFSTTFSPGAGLPFFNAFRYLFPRFYFWCMVPDVQWYMEGCPDTERKVMLYLILSALFNTVVFFTTRTIYLVYRSKKHREAKTEAEESMKDGEFYHLQETLYRNSKLFSLSDRLPDGSRTTTAPMKTEHEDAESSEVDV